MGVERIAVIGGAKSGGGGEAEQVAEVDGNSNLGRKFSARDEIRRIEELILAMNRSRKGVEGEIDWQLLPGSLLDGAEARLRIAAEIHAVLRAELQIAAIAEAGNVEAEAMEIMVRKTELRISELMESP